MVEVNFSRVQILKVKSCTCVNWTQYWIIGKRINKGLARINGTVTLQLIFCSEIFRKLHAKYVFYEIYKYQYCILLMSVCKSLFGINIYICVNCHKYCGGTSTVQLITVKHDIIVEIKRLYTKQKPINKPRCVMHIDLLVNQWNCLWIMAK